MEPIPNPWIKWSFGMTAVLVIAMVAMYFIVGHVK